MQLGSGEGTGRIQLFEYMLREQRPLSTGTASDQLLGLAIAGQSVVVGKRRRGEQQKLAVELGLEGKLVSDQLRHQLFGSARAHVVKRIGARRQFLITPQGRAD